MHEATEEAPSSDCSLSPEDHGGIGLPAQDRAEDAAALSDPGPPSNF